MNAFFDGYVHLKTTLKQFVEQYKRALRCKVEKEFQSNFKSFLQMVPCAAQYEIELQFQSVYTIAKFREAQDEFTGKVYCDVISTLEGDMLMTNEVHEDVMHEGRRRKKTFFVSFERENCDIVCSCHLFEFRGILCRHSIAVLIRCDVTSFPKRYILRRWRRDVSRAHTRVAVNYDGLISSPGQLRYDELCHEFAKLADLATDDERQSRVILDWIKLQCKDLLMLKTSHSGSNAITHHTIQVADQCTDSQNDASVSIKDMKSSRRKGVPKKLRKKGPLESSSKNTKTASSKGRRPTGRHIGTQESAVHVHEAQQQNYSMQPPPPCLQYSMPSTFPVSQYTFATPFSHSGVLPMSNYIAPSSSNIMHNSQGKLAPLIN
ncbi:protein FAR-RED IMPAIRED RESPONSE 1-like [Olea europaea var. sylvestris]|uniref:protein FAR-RED IMPAIRED RESPONSE 1-like n=1 Tax=Olea europaea var. sylvestris TaxID=158386 RepID=UPI000C1D62F6|nr:protein FAR-RED IMPAIRED RESPONSE 1-like [Olea europaea var. sylvestris]